jgi:hypothetical protein
MATLESLEEAFNGLRGTVEHFRDHEFPEAMKAVDKAFDRNDGAHEEIKGLVSSLETEVKRVNGDMGVLKAWRIEVLATAKAAATAVGLTGRVFWALLGAAWSIGLVVLGAYLHGAAG